MASRAFFKRIGPGIVTGAADDDPSGIGTYTSVGAAAGYGFLWSALWLLPLAFAVQEASARLALVTGKGLAALIKSRLPRGVLVLAVVLVAVANTVNIAADLVQVADLLALADCTSGQSLRLDTGYRLALDLLALVSLAIKSFIEWRHEQELKASANSPSERPTA